jgi:thiol-disulfide isomerase/thioredoxin
MTRFTIFLLLIFAARTDAQSVEILSNRGESQATYDCAAPDMTVPREESHRAILDYVARMAGSGAVPPEALPALMKAYEHREWEYLVPMVVEHACREGVIPPPELRFPDPGTAAPAFQLTTLDGSRTVSLSDYRGRHVIIEFWATWCLPCIASLREFNEWARRSPDLLTVLAINYGEDPNTAQTWLQRNGFDEVIGLADPDKAVAEAYVLKGRVGLNYLLDRQGRVVPGLDGSRMRAVTPEYERILAAQLGW